MTNKAIQQINQNFAEMGARIRALEFIVSQNVAVSYVKAGVTTDAMKENHERVRQDMRRITFPSMHAVHADAWADELQRALDDLLKQIEASFEDRMAG